MIHQQILEKAIAVVTLLGTLLCPTLQNGQVELLTFSSTFCLSLIQVNLFLPAVLIDVFSMCESDPKSASQTPHKHRVAILITLSCVFVLQQKCRVLAHFQVL